MTNDERDALIARLRAYDTRNHRGKYALLCREAAAALAADARGLAEGRGGVPVAWRCECGADVMMCAPHGFMAVMPGKLWGPRNEGTCPRCERAAPAAPPADGFKWGWEKEIESLRATVARLETQLADTIKEHRHIREEYCTRGEAVERLTRERDELVNEKKARSMIDPITRMHNLCDGLAEHRRESPYDEKSWELADESYQEKCREVKRLQAELAAARTVVAAADAMRDAYIRSWFDGGNLKEHEAECATWPVITAYDAARSATKEKE